MLRLKDLKQGDLCTLSCKSSDVYRVLSPYRGVYVKLYDLCRKRIVLGYINAEVFPF